MQMLLKQIGTDFRNTFSDKLTPDCKSISKNIITRTQESDKVENRLYIWPELKRVSDYSIFPHYYKISNIRILNAFECFVVSKHVLDDDPKTIHISDNAKALKWKPVDRLSEASTSIASKFPFLELDGEKSVGIKIVQFIASPFNNISKNVSYFAKFCSKLAKMVTYLISEGVRKYEK